MKETNDKIESIDSNIKSYIENVDKKLNLLNTTVNQNCNDIKELKNIQSLTDNRIHQVQNEAKAQLFKTITTIQRDTSETIKSECERLESHLGHKIDDVEEKLTTNLTSQQQIIDSEITDIRENLQTKMEEIIINNPMSTQFNAQLNIMNNKIVECEENVKKLHEQKYTPIPNIYVTCGNNNNTSELQLPNFHGRTNPIEFLAKLKKYYEKGLNNNNSRDPSEYLIDVIEQALEQHASKWFYLIKDEIKTWSEFEHAFISKYWSRETQRSIKLKLENEIYRDSGKLNRTEYFIERVLMLKSITPQPTEIEIIECLAEHFDLIIKDAMRVQNVKTIKEFEQLLQREDLRHQPNKPRPYQPPRSPNLHNPAPSRPPYNPNYRQNPRHNPYESDRRPPVNHNAYPPRFSHYNQSSRPAEYQRSQQNYQRGSPNHQRRQQRSPTRNDISYPQTRPENSYRRYPTPEQSRVCSAVIDTTNNTRQIPPRPSHNNPNPSTQTSQGLN